MTIYFYEPVFNSSSEIIDVRGFWGYFDDDIIAQQTPQIAYQVDSSVNNALVALNVPFNPSNVYRIRWYVAWFITLFDPEISSFFDSFPPRYKFGNITFSRTGATQRLENLTYLQQYTDVFITHIGDVFNISAQPPQNLIPSQQTRFSFVEDFIISPTQQNLCNNFGLNLRPDLVLTQYIVYTGLRVADNSAIPLPPQSRFFLP